MFMRFPCLLLRWWWWWAKNLGKMKRRRQLCLSLRAPASEGHGASRDDHFALRLWYLMMMMVINSFIWSHFVNRHHNRTLSTRHHDHGVYPGRISWCLNSLSSCKSLKKVTPRRKSRHCFLFPSGLMSRQTDRLMANITRCRCAKLVVCPCHQINETGLQSNIWFGNCER